MQFVVAITHAVENPEAAARFLCQALGFQRQEQQGAGILLNNGAIVLRVLAETPELAASTLHLELQCQSLEDVQSDLLAYPGVVAGNPPCWVDETRMQSSLGAPHNLVILLTRVFNEDELGLTPALPCSLIWDEQAEACIRQVLRQVPLSFRGPARIRITEYAEMLAGKQGSIKVTLDDALRSLNSTTPEFQHPTLCDALAQLGIDPLPYFASSTTT